MNSTMILLLIVGWFVVGAYTFIHWQTRVEKKDLLLSDFGITLGFGLLGLISVIIYFFTIHPITLSEIGKKVIIKAK